MPICDTYTAEHVELYVKDKAGTMRPFTGVQGDISFGDEMPGTNREVSDVFEKGRQTHSHYGQEQPVTVTVETLEGAETIDAINFCLARGIYAPGGTSPMVSVDCGGSVAAVELYAQVTPPSGTARLEKWARAYLTSGHTAPAGAAATRTLSFRTFGGRVTL
jgi:hypothetical protein